MSKKEEIRYRIAIQRYGTSGLSTKAIEFRNISLLAKCDIDTLKSDIIQGLEHVEEDLQEAKR